MGVEGWDRLRSAKIARLNWLLPSILGMGPMYGIYRRNGGRYCNVDMLYSFPVSIPWRAPRESERDVDDGLRKKRFTVRTDDTFV